MFLRASSTSARRPNTAKHSILGTSGQTLDDIFRYVESDDRINLAEYNLKWRHLAPTAPDTLWCYPYTEDDPFIIEETPHLFFVGNQPKFETKLIEENNARCRLVLLPSFAETGQIVLVNTVTLEPRVVQFDGWPKL